MNQETGPRELEIRLFPDNIRIKERSLFVDDFMVYEAEIGIDQHEHLVESIFESIDSVVPESEFSEVD